MCRLFGLVSDQPVKIVFSMLNADNAIRRQSHNHSDGWGIGYYVNESAVIFKEPLPAFGSNKFEKLSRTIQSNKFIVHIRQRSAGKINVKNTHPFCLENWLLAQNGGIGNDWHLRIREEIGKGKIKGKTSGEHLLFWLYHRAGRFQGEHQIQAVKNALNELIDNPINIKSANFILTTGDYLYAFRYAPPVKVGRTLFYLERTKNRSAQSEKTGLDFKLASPPQSADKHVFLVASEKITVNEDWHIMTNGELLVIDNDLNLKKFCLL